MPHGHCYYWEPFILWSQAITNSIIALAYFAIPISLVQIVRRRNDFRYTWMLVLFAIFILGCGATHVMDVINIWTPFYYTDVIIRMITALASIGTAIIFILITPKLILIPSAEKWKAVNLELSNYTNNLENEVELRTAELTENIATMNFLTDTIPQMVWTANKNGELDYYNKNWYAYTGLSEKESMAYGWQTVIHPDEKQALTERWNYSVKTSENFQFEFRIKNARDGSYRWHLGRAHPMRDENNEVLKWFGTATDIHDQKEKSDEVRKVNKELDQFIYTASHDLKAPVANLEGLMQLVEQRCDKENQEENRTLYAMMNKQVNRLKLIIHDLSDVGQIKKASRDDFENVNLRTMVNDFVQSNVDKIDESETSIQLDLNEEVIYFSPQHLQIILFNLLDNAIKYTKYANKSQIKVTTAIDDGYWVMKVEDNGIGINEEHQLKIFDMFQRFSHHKDGTGMGLYIVKTTVEKYKGCVSVESEAGQGSTFIVSLPAPLLKAENQYKNNGK
ncbi:sensor histidine kinase [Catalinimonas alkaloidigena]|uniref:sensor histidine kinase n=1 Tax=Catalinimonas alkaloidigena TaxID=1075417 RepID=UPI002406349D|nr:PAS domain-containing sensor histidine kinase [Catalinimonas alkaloidigena]